MRGKGEQLIAHFVGRRVTNLLRLATQIDGPSTSCLAYMAANSVYCPLHPYGFKQYRKGLCFSSRFRGYQTVHEPALWFVFFSYTMGGA